MRLLLLGCLVALAWAAGICVPSDCSDFADLRVGSFNIQVFGSTKMAKPGIAPVLVEILHRYDISLIQEIRDSSGTAILNLWALLNASLPIDHQYSLVLSERLGRSSSKEQYAYFYKPSLLSILATYQYPVALDQFERPPFSVHVRFNSITFGVSGCHISPDAARVEIANLNLATGALKAEWNESNLLVMGDFNAGCSYITSSQLAAISFRAYSNYTWLINDTADTTSGTTDCPYDRFVVTTEFVTAYVAGTAMPFNFSSAYGLNDSFAQDVSDHYPIEMTLATPEPTISPATPPPVTASPSTSAGPPSPPPASGSPSSSTTAAFPTPPPPTLSSQSGSSSPSGSRKNRSKTPMVVGIVIGCVVAVAIIAAVIAYFAVFKAKRNNDEYQLTFH